MFDTKKNEPVVAATVIFRDGEKMLCRACFDRGGFSLADAAARDGLWTQRELDEAANDQDVGESRCDLCQAVLAVPSLESA